MADEIDETDYYQHDFTTASEWEVFTARLEEVFHEWKLPLVKESLRRPLDKDALSLGVWKITEELIKFADVELIVQRHQFKDNESDTEIYVEAKVLEKRTGFKTCQTFIDLMSIDNDFCLLNESAGEREIHPIVRWYCLRDFVIIKPVHRGICNESQIRVLLSSAHIAVAESRSEVPVFVQVLELNQRVFFGVCECGSTRMSFDIVHLANAPPNARFLPGLIDTFKGKIATSNRPNVLSSVRLTYNLTSFPRTEYRSKRNYPFAFEMSSIDEEDLLDENMDLDEDKISKDSNLLPFGSPVDPVQEIVLHASWRNVRDHILMDSPNFSEFDPMVASSWHIAVHYEDIPNCYMGECLTELMSTLDCTLTLADFYGDMFTYGSGVIMTESNPLEKLTESKITISSVLPNLKQKSGTSVVKKVNGPLHDTQIMQMLYYLFPDAQKDSEHAYPIFTKENTEMGRIKSAPVNSLLYRLGDLMALCVTFFGGQKAMAQLWAEFVQEMRYRVERCIQIPGICTGFPNPRTCLLHQKLQLLNICMERRKIRDGGLPFALSDPSKLNNSGQDESEDEFFDCPDDDNDGDNGNAKYSPWNKPEGRLSRLDDLMLIDSDEPLYIPITQDPVPKTEDQLEDDAEVLLRLGPDSELRAQMMSASLLSDMESFKAANPNGKLEDFIRWYSPRDWIEDDPSDNRKGQLSTRMLLPGNTWQTVWETAKPVPARRQKRLFDDTKEAEKVLHYLESLNLGQIVEAIMIPLFHSCILRLEREADEKADSLIPKFKENIEKLLTYCSKLSRDSPVSNQQNNRGNISSKWDTFISDVTQMEYTIIATRSLIKKLFPDHSEMQTQEERIIHTVLDNYEVEIINGSQSNLAQRLLQLFAAAKLAQSDIQETEDDSKRTKKVLTIPNEKQYVLRVSNDMGVIQKDNPQFLRAIIGEKEFRLCGAFSKNTTFF